MARRLFTSESVTEGHPDKMADQISDAILDSMIKDDPGSRVAVETMITTGQVHVAGEVTTQTYVDIPGIIRDKILEIGYDSSLKGYDGASCGVSVSIGAQSPDIADQLPLRLPLRRTLPETLAQDVRHLGGLFHGKIRVQADVAVGPLPDGAHVGAGEADGAAEGPGECGPSSFRLRKRAGSFRNAPQT